jgi:hypothetical protein
MKPIKLTVTGTLCEPDGATFSDRDEIRSVAGVHKDCGGQFILGYFSERWNNLNCFKCGLKVMIPSRLKTYGDLRVWRKRRIMVRARRKQ